jgi:hypothetical protein
VLTDATVSPRWDEGTPDDERGDGMYAVAPEMVERYETVGGVAVSGEGVEPPAGPPQGDRGWNRFLIGPTRAQLAHGWDAVDPAIKTGPQAFLVGRKDEGATFKPHYHPVDQFQVVLSGGCRIKRQPLVPGSFHYADANTPYGPIVTGSDGLEFMTVREQLTNVRVRLPDGRDGINRAGRNIVAHVRPRWHSTDMAGSNGVLEELVVPAEEDGLEVRAIHLRRSDTYRDDATDRRGRQFVVVLSGSVRHENGAFGKSSVFFTEPGETGCRFTGEAAASTLLLLRFPARKEPRLLG